MKHRHPGRLTSGLWSDEVLGQSCEKHLKRGARKVRPRVSRRLVCRRAGRRGVKLMQHCTYNDACVAAT